MQVRFHDLVCGALVVGATMTAADDARACGPCQDFTQQIGLDVGDRRAPLPADARVFLPGTGLDVDSVVVTGTIAGEVVDVPFGVVAADDTIGSVFVELTWAFVDAGEIVIATNLGDVTHPIGAREDIELPTTPTVEVTAGVDAPCCDTIGATLAVSDARDDGGLAQTPQATKVVVSSSSGERVAFFGVVNGQIALGSSTGECLMSDPLAVVGEDVAATVSTIDWAGNESSTVTVTLAYEERGAASCGPIDGGGPFGLGANCAQSTTSWSALSLSALALAAVRRRRRNVRA